MTEVKVNTISGLGTAGLKILSPLGISSAPPSVGGLNIEGHVDVVNSGAEVVTVPSESFGLNVKAPKTPYTSTSKTHSNFVFSDRDGNRRAVLSSGTAKNLEFATNITGPMMTDASQLTGGTMYYLSNTEINNFGVFGATSEFKNSVNFSYANFPRCSGIPTVDEHLINLNVLKQWILNITTLKTWSVFGTRNNGGIGPIYGRSGNFFKRLFGSAKTKLCCSAQPGAFDQGIYNQVLQGSWVIIAYSVGVRSCSCSDNEQFHFPIDASAVWTVTNDSIKNTLPANLGTYNLFGFAIKPLDVTNITS